MFVIKIKLTCTYLIKKDLSWPILPHVFYMTRLIVPHCLAHCTLPVVYNDPFCNSSVITFFICLKRFCNIYCKCKVCRKVYIKRLCMVSPITPSWKNYQSSRKNAAHCTLLSPTYRSFSYFIFSLDISKIYS